MTSNEQPVPPQTPQSPQPSAVEERVDKSLTSSGWLNRPPLQMQQIALDSIAPAGSAVQPPQPVRVTMETPVGGDVPPE
jgi:hypothetical protein